MIKPTQPHLSVSVHSAVISLEKLYPNDAELGKRIRKLIKEIEDERQ